MSNFFDDVKNACDFEEVARYHGVEFGRNRKSLCPFHDEQTPSFSLHPSRSFAYCFACNASADAVSLEYHLGKHSSMLEAAQVLNQRFNLGLKSNGFDKEKAEELNNALTLLGWYCAQANQNLLENEAVLSWLKEKKGITVEDVKTYRIGYVGVKGLRVKEGCISVFQQNREVFHELGILKEKDSGSVEFFTNRLIFPIWQRGQIKSLRTRAYPDNGNNQYKWLGPRNSEFTPHKPIAFPENLNCPECCIVEGITDAISLIKNGFPAAALLGTDASQYNNSLFEKAKAKLIFALDPDKAGRGASYKLARKFKGYIAELGDKDPDELLAELGLEQFKSAIETGIEKAKYYLDAVIEREDILGALQDIAALPMTSEQDKWLNKLAAKHPGVTVRSLRKDLNKIINAKEPATPSSENIIRDPKPKLHPAMDLLDGNLIYGSYSQTRPVYISNRKIVDYTYLSSEYAISDEPRHLRFSADGIREYLKGKECNWQELYERIFNLLNKYIIFRSTWQIAITAIWIMGTYLHRCFPLYPYLWVQSPTKRCGKTRLLELISELAFNSDGIQTAPTQAVLYRVPSISAGTLCWDEAENLYNGKEKGERLEILNSAYRKGTQVARCEGEDNKVRFFEVFRPIVLAGISTLPDTVADRAIKIELIRKSRDEKVARLQIDRMQIELQDLRDKLHIFALEKAAVILDCYNDFRDNLIPESVDDRLRDALEILFSIGACIHSPEAGFPLHSILTEVANELSGVRKSEEDEITYIRAIGILKDELTKLGKEEIILNPKEAVKVFQEGGLDWLKEEQEARRIFKKFKIKSKSHRVDGEVIRGYKIELNNFNDLVKRYPGDS